MSRDPASLKIDRSQAVLLIIDVQERMAPAVPADDRAACEKNTVILIEMARRLGIPVVLSEHYVKGLGPTVAPIAEALARPGLTLERIEKVEFPCTACAAFPALRERLGRSQWLLCGMETHVCVYQTARGLLAAGARVQVVADAVASRASRNRDAGLRLIERAGGVVTTTEMVLFDALERSGTEDFKVLQRLVR
jgi:nicotinamidase-related amidase